MKRSCLFFLAAIWIALYHSNSNATPCPAKAVAADTSFWHIEDLVQAVVCGPEINVISQMDIPYTITTPGTYTLCEHLVSTGTDATPITVSSTRDVIVNLNRHTIKQERPTNTVGERPMIFIDNSNNVTVFNGSLRIAAPAMGSPMGTASGIHADNSTNVRVFDLNVIGDGNTSLDAFGIRLVQCESIALMRCTGRNLTHAFDLSATATSDFCIVHDCNAFESLSTGFLVRNSASQMTVTRNIAFGCGGTGFLIGDGSVFQPTDIILRSNHAIRCGSDGAQTFRCGFEARNASRIMFDKCSSLRSGTDGFLMASGSSNITLCDCITQLDGTDGVVTDTSASNVSILRCKSLHHAGMTQIGFRNMGPVASNNAFSCFAKDNGGGHFVGFATPTRTIATLSTAKYWFNVSP